MCYLHIKQIAISQERRAIWKNYTWSSFIISRALSNKTNLILISYNTLTLLSVTVTSTWTLYNAVPSLLYTDLHLPVRQLNQALATYALYVVFFC